MKILSFLRYRSYLLFPEHRLLSLTILGLTVSIGVLLATTDNTRRHHEDSTTPLVLSQLNVLQTKMTALQDSARKPLPDIDLSTMTQQLQQLSQQLENVRAQNLNHFNQALNQTEKVLATRLDIIQRLVRDLDKKRTPIKVLAPKNLPFHVLSLDSIQQIPVASVTYDFKTVPLEKGDSLAGWQMISIDYGKQRLEFKNGKQEHVLLTHEHIG